MTQHFMTARVLSAIRLRRMHMPLIQSLLFSVSCIAQSFSQLNYQIRAFIRERGTSMAAECNHQRQDTGIGIRPCPEAPANALHPAFTAPPL